ncbi:MAG: hypothetical protein RIQ94_748 [Pseudomonadota bacterium]
MIDLDQIIFFFNEALLVLWLINTLFDVMRSLLALNWPKANGEVACSDILEDNDGEDRWFTPKIEYRYKVRGKEYHSHRIVFGSFVSVFKFKAKFVQEKLRVRQNVTVAYNAMTPSESVLYTGIHLFHVIDVGLLIASFYVNHHVDHYY